MSLNLFTDALKTRVVSEPLLILQEMKKPPASANSQFQLISNGYKVLRNRQNCLWSVFALKPEVILLCKVYSTAQKATVKHAQMDSRWLQDSQNHRAQTGKVCGSGLLGQPRVCAEGSGDNYLSVI